MPLIGWPELVLILAILILIFGGSRIRDLAKGLGDSVREFKKASSPESEKEKEEDAIIEAAKKMGIKTEGKSINQILDEMNKRATESAK